mmetsp:Transcript_13333/g.27058  ORF Transcript_13333/g.27058 Transcript_13333/m.27058 type:complete len:319 (-) Transcript_13333:54-1010(-)
MGIIDPTKPPEATRASEHTSFACPLLGRYFAQPFIHPFLRGDVDPVGRATPVDRQEPRRSTCSMIEREDFVLRSCAKREGTLLSAGLSRGGPAVYGLDLHTVECALSEALRRGGRRDTARRTASPVCPALQSISTARSARRRYAQVQGVLVLLLHDAAVPLRLHNRPFLRRRLRHRLLLAVIIVQVVVLVKHDPQPGDGPGSSPARSALSGKCNQIIRLVRRLLHPLRLGLRLSLCRRPCQSSRRHIGGMGCVRTCLCLEVADPLSQLARLDAGKPCTGRLDSVIRRPLKSSAHDLQLEGLVVRDALLLGVQAVNRRW